MKRMRRLVSGAFVLAVSVTPVCADVLCLRDGRIYEGLDLQHVEGGIELAYEHGRVFVPSALVLHALDEAAAPFVPRTPEEKVKASQGLRPFGDEWVPEGRLDRLVQDQVKKSKAALEELRAHQDWVNHYSEKSKNFNFESTVPRHIFEDYRNKMEAYFQTFKKTWKIGKPANGKLNVCLYSKRKEFHRTSGASSNTLGYFRHVPPYDLNIYYDRFDPTRSEDVMFHEANHYLQKLIDEDFSYPHWPGEALAEYYGASSYDLETKTFETGLVQEGRLIQIQRDIDSGEWWSVEKIVASGDDSVFEHYTWGWALVHYLMNQKEHEKDFVKFFKALAKGKDIEQVRGAWNMRTVRGEEIWRAFRDYLGLKSAEDVRELEADFHRYIQEDLTVQSVAGIEKAAMAAYTQNRNLRALRLFQEAVDAGSTNARTYFYYGKQLMQEGKGDEAIAMWKRSIELDPLVGETWHLLGEATHRKDQDEGDRLLALAREIDPDGDFD